MVSDNALDHNYIFSLAKRCLGVFIDALPALPVVSVSTSLSVRVQAAGATGLRSPPGDRRVPGGTEGAEKRISIKRS